MKCGHSRQFFVPDGDSVSDWGVRDPGCDEGGWGSIHAPILALALAILHCDPAISFIVPAKPVPPRSHPQSIVHGHSHIDSEILSRSIYRYLFCIIQAAGNC